MPVSFPEIKTWQGLYKQANSFSVPDGALEVASNVVISKDGRISKRRGFYQYFDAAVDTLNNLFYYQSKLLAVFSDKMKYFTDAGSEPNLTGTGTTLTGETVAVTGTRTSLSVQSNNNLYFTSDNGLLKLDAYNSTIFKAGIAPALDMVGRFIAANGPIAGESQAAWRVIFGRRDANDNLLLGSPSDITTLTNSKISTAAWTRTTNVVTVTNTTHNLAVGMNIVISGSTGAVPIPSGTYTVTVITSTTFSFADIAANSSGNTDYTATRSTLLEFSVPSDITSTTQAYFFQLYRTDQTDSSSVSPDPDFKLIDEQMLTSGQISARFVQYEDVIDDILLGAELYTNPNSREGELQANDRPPLAADVTLFKNHLIYSNIQTRHVIDLALIDAGSITTADVIQIKVDATTRSYIARTGVGNSTVRSISVTGTGTVTITYTAHGFANTDIVYISRVTGTVPEGSYSVSGVTANTFDITSLGNTATFLDFQGVSTATPTSIFQLDSSSSSISVQLRNTAKGLVKAINRDTSSLVIARYTSDISSVPGKFRLLAKGFTGIIYIKASSTASGEAFSPIFPTSFASGTQVYSKNDVQPNTFLSSKIGEPEAAPFTNTFPVGARNKAIIRSVALRDSVIHLTEGGVLKTVGDSVSNFVTTALDTTVIIAAKNSVALLNNQVVFLSNQGVCLVTESSVQIISRKIEDNIQPILGNSALAAETGAVSYESERLYLLSTLEPNESTAGVVWVYNILNDSWTTWDTLFKQGIVAGSDTLYLITSADVIAKERKNQTKIDFSGQNYSVTVVSVASGNLSAVISSGSVVPEAGDVIVKSSVFSRIESVETNGVDYTVTFLQSTNLVAADSVILYSNYTSIIKPAPFHAGLIGRQKQFSQMQIHLRDNAISKLLITFTGAVYGGSEQVIWTSLLGYAGWGLAPWSFFPWGQEEGINLTLQTEPAPIIRLYIPRFQQRNTFIQPVLEHSQAGEALDIQALAYTVRPYGERVSK